MYLHCLFQWASVRRRRRHHTSTNFEKKKVQKKAKLKRGERRFGSETDEVMEGMRGRMEGWKEGWVFITRTRNVSSDGFRDRRGDGRDEEKDGRREEGKKG